MKLIITSSIKRSEIKPLKNVFSLSLLKFAAEKSLKGLGDCLKSPAKLPFTSLQKIYLTSPGGAGRAVFLITVGDDVSVLVLLRLKKDKLIGSNITTKNARFNEVVLKNLDLIHSDLENGDYEEFEL